MSRADSPLRNRLIFLVGAQRSGTNWLQRMLGVHPDIASLPAETHLFSYGLTRLAETVHHGVVSSPSTTGLFMDPDTFHDAMRDFCDVALGSLARVVAPGASYILERSPHHALVLDLVGAVYPDAQVVHIIRDGRDVVRSQLAQSYGPETVAAAAAEWRRTIESARASAPRLRTYVEVRYEDLLTDPRARLADVFGRLGIDADDVVLDAAVAESGVRFNVDPSDPRLGAGKWQDSWTSADVSAFMAEVGPLAEEFGIAADATATTAARTRRRVIRRPRVRATSTRRGEDAGTAGTEPLARATRLIDDFLGDLASRRDSALRDRVSPTVDVRVVTAEGEQRATGDDGVALLLASVEDDPVGWAEQVRGTVHPGTPVFTVVLTHRAPDGRTTDRVFVVRPDGDRIGKVTYYRMPLGRA